MVTIQWLDGYILRNIPTESSVALNPLKSYRQDPSKQSAEQQAEALSGHSTDIESL